MQGGTRDTIAAIATPPGRGGIGIVRVSGPAVPDIAARICGRLPEPRSAVHARFRNATGEVVDAGLALYFPGPKSFTGEHVLELHGHGGAVVMDMLLAAVLEAGARPARPGEFSQRAFLNDKMDLAQAEAVADLIDSASRTAALSAQRTLQGEFSRRINLVVDALVELRAYVEGAIDFPEEEIDFLAEGAVGERVEGIIGQLEAVRAEAVQGCLLREGMTVVIAGAPNVGKSSLLNRISGRESAIVTEVPGTTRDVLREYIHLDGLPLNVLDTAGLRTTQDRVEREGIARARTEISSADVVLALVDDREQNDAEVRALFAEFSDGPDFILVRNKIDLSGNPPGVRDISLGTEIRISAKTGAGFENLVAALKQAVGYRQAGEGSFTARRRHIEAIGEALEHARSARAQCGKHACGELIAEDLGQMQRSLGEITGTFTSDDLLERIFSTFCIGK
ncbi:MAG TPA: tRNA uridine-5-carboxymethylaminomethyl(34) synthesis GTPase MnmE [Gammaproteobacteria bacterium]|nr:tRNA uridine-5-carboxymethylaminomethyl(34) synthesis GTPase MnmE [Gammaproteobacteria bacterium]